MFQKTIHLTVFLISASHAESDCREQMAHFYPESERCPSEMTCSSDYACYIDPATVLTNSCAAYECKMESICPEGTTYLPYFPAQSDSNEATESSNQSGYACYPNDQIPDHYFNCDFDQDDDFRLNFDARVPDITRHFNYDNRNVTLISWADYNNYSDPTVMVDLFESSTCVGVVNENGFVEFNGIVNGTGGCYFTNLGLEIDEDGIPFFTQKFVIGYDDLVEVYPTGGIVIKRYGKNFIVSCRIKAWDALNVDPGAEGNRESHEIVTDTEITFKLTMFKDDTFETKFENGELVNLDSETPIDETTIYVEAAAEINDETVDWMIHLKRCFVQDQIREIIDAENDEFGEWEITDNGFDFLVDGVLATNQFTNRNMAINASRVEWTDDSADTYIIDQFKVDMWKPSQYGPGYQVLLQINCEMMACEVDAFTQIEDNSICRIENGTTRYNNLINSSFRSTRQSPRFPTKTTRSGSVKTRPQRSEVSDKPFQIIFNGSVECTISSLFMLILALLY